MSRAYQGIISIVQKPGKLRGSSMPREELVFECRRCGTCCRDLLQEDQGILRGLTLLPGEEEAFVGASVRPAIGRGRRPYETGFIIIAHQLLYESCPHLGDPDCLIYSERPASCRQFPFSLREGPDGRQQLGLDLSCPSLAELVDGRSNLALTGLGTLTWGVESGYGSISSLRNLERNLRPLGMD
jgi:Fe-S-cluster containining protein